MFLISWSISWRRYPYWYFHLRSPQSPYREETLDNSDSISRENSLQETQHQAHMNSSMIFLSKLVAVLNRPKTDKSAMRGGRERASRRSPREVLQISHTFHFHVIDQCAILPIHSHSNLRVCWLMSSIFFQMLSGRWTWRWTRWWRFFSFDVRKYGCGMCWTIAHDSPM